jgi:hypothetical protein
MIKKFKIFESIYDDLFFRKSLFDHISGKLPIKDSYKLVEYAQDYFNWKIPNDLKYEGPVYRVVQYKTKENYKELLKKGMAPIQTQRYWSCAKDLNSIERVKSFTSHKRYKYFITYKFDVTYNDVLFDMNKMYKYLFGCFSEYKDENEVVVLTTNFQKILPENIVDHGLIVWE